MVRSARRTANHPEHLFVEARVDNDDPNRSGYFTEKGWTVRQGSRRRLPQLWNELAAGNNYDILMMGADDLRFRTTGWDDDVVKAFEQWPDRIGLVYADDGIQGQRLATHSFVTKEWVEAVGFYLPDTLHGDFVDNWLMSLAVNIDRTTYLERTYIEHLHPFVAKAPMDDTYSYRLAGFGPQIAHSAWQDLLATDAMPTAVQKLKGAMT
jgi:hypothetical protein